MQPGRFSCSPARTTKNCMSHDSVHSIIQRNNALGVILPHTPIRLVTQELVPQPRSEVFARSRKVARRVLRLPKK